MANIIIETLIAAPREICFDLARDVRAHAESASFSAERIVEPGRLTGLLEEGDLVTFEGRHFGIRQRFTARVIEMRRPEFFVDEMVRGAFLSMRHRHEFHERDGVTLMRDLLDWRAPLGLIADPLFLKRHMRWFVTTKQRALKETAEQRGAAG